MVFDPNTLCWVDDCDMHSSSESSGHYYIPHRAVRNRCEPSYIRNEPSPYIRNSAGFMQTVWGKFKDFVPMLGGIILGVGIVYGLNWLDDKYSIVSRVKACFSSAPEAFSKKESIKHGEHELQQEVPASQHPRFFVICPFCGTRFDVTQFAQRYSAFDCDCPNTNCRRILHVENHK